MYLGSCGKTKVTAGHKKEMRARQTVIVCGADGDRAQFEPFKWPKHATIWIGVGCVVRNPPSDVERAALALSGWLRIIERAARVPCAMIVACGGIRVSSLPVFSAWWTSRVVTVVGGGMKRTVRREGGVETCARKALSSFGVGVATDYRIVLCGARSIELHPLARCAVCDTPIRPGFRRFATMAPNSTDKSEDNSVVEADRVMWLPPVGVCRGCSVRTFHFSIDGESIRAIDAPTAGVRAIFGQGAHESAELPRGGAPEHRRVRSSRASIPRRARRKHEAIRRNAQ